MLTLVICLVVVGGSIVAVLVLTLGDDHQPATDAAPARRETAAEPERRSRGRREHRRREPEPQVPEEPRVRVVALSPWRRARAAVGLLALACMIGLVVAGLVALALLAVALGLREAVGS